MEPRLIMGCDPRADHQAIKEASYMNIPVIALCDADSPLKYVDIAIPANNKGDQSIALMFYLLARETKMIRGEIPRNEEWSEMVDLFMYREITEKKKSIDDDDLDAGNYRDEVEADDNAVAKFRDGDAGENDEEEEEGDAAWAGQTPA